MITKFETGKTYVLDTNVHEFHDDLRTGDRLRCVSDVPDGHGHTRMEVVSCARYQGLAGCAQYADFQDLPRLTEVVEC